MESDVNQVIQEAKMAVEKAIEHLAYELTKIRTGKTSASILDDIRVDYYGTPTPINQVSSISSPDARSLSIQPWEKKLLSLIEKAIFEANLGVTPMNDGENIRLNFPPLTEERRRELAKQAKHFGEEAKISIRSARHKVLEVIRKAVKDGYPEDTGKNRENEIQELVTDFVKKVDQIITTKEQDIMKV